MTVICSKCRCECKDFEFDKNLMPVCSVCSGRLKVMESVVSLQESRFERAWNGKDAKLSGWFK